jgi:hypothetical protein
MLYLVYSQVIVPFYLLRYWILGFLALKNEKNKAAF